MEDLARFASTFADLADPDTTAQALEVATRLIDKSALVRLAAARTPPSGPRESNAGWRRL